MEKETDTTNDSLVKAWEDHEGPAILATVGANKSPNITLLQIKAVYSGAERLL
ncbi:MAG: hypothetical protein ACFUZC_11745 [Chthoniobacteraceae bacterium]